MASFAPPNDTYMPAKARNGVQSAPAEFNQQGPELFQRESGAKQPFAHSGQRR